MHLKLFAAFALCLFLTGCGNQYEMSDEAPLGQLDVIDQILSEKKLKRDEKKLGPKNTDHGPTQVSTIGPGKRYSYTDETRANTMHVAYVYMDEDGNVTGVGGEFASGTRDFEYGVYRVGRFVAEYWVAASGAPPVFVNNDGGGMIGKERYRASFETDQLKGIWFKHVIHGNRGDRIIDQVMIGRK